MNYLVDTNGWIAFFEDSPRLQDRPAEIMESSEARCCISIASIWEAAIKLALGKLTLPYDLEKDLPRILEDCGIEVLPIAYADAVAVRELEAVHGDPFDRIQVVQARRLRLEIISADPIFDRYGVKRIW